MSQPTPAPIKTSYVGTWIASLLLIVAFVFGLLLFPPYFDKVEGLAEPSSNVLFFGRFHPILVHLPVGVLVFLIVVEILCLRRSMEEKFGQAALLALWMGAAGAVFAVLAGIMLSREGGFEGGTFTLHQGLGIIGTAGILLGLILRLTGMSTENRGLVDGYRAVLFLSFSIMGVGAHFGANLVHGSKYMTQYAPPFVAEQIVGMEDWMLSLVEGPKEKSTPEAPAVVTSSTVTQESKVTKAPTTTPDVPKDTPVAKTTPAAPSDKPVPPMVAGAEGKLVFDHLVLPILEEKCNNCHNEDKSKGGLRMDTYDLTIAGGDTEGNVVPGKPDHSLLITRINLPDDDDEHMPPEGKPQISAEELALLSWWIEQGASNTMTVKDANLPEATKSLVEKLLATPTTSLRKDDAAPSSAISRVSWLRRAALMATAITLTAVTQAADEAKGPSPAVTEVIKKVEAAGASLLPISSGASTYRFTALNVAKEFGDAGLDMLMPIADSLISVDLARTQVTDAGVAKIAKFTKLKELRLDNTGIGDAALEHLKGLAQLEYLNVYGSKVTDAGLQKLAGLANLKALYVWQTGVTKAGVAQLRGKLPKAHINNGWSAEDDAKPVAAAPAAVVAAAKPVAPAAQAAAPAPAAGVIDPKAAATLVVYKDVVAPILANKCNSCHGEEKSKGKLKLHTFADIKKGGSEGEVNVVAGKAAESLLLKRVALPLDDDEHMPPEDKEQLTKEEVALLTWWINEGASETQTLDKAKRTAEVDGALAVVLKDKIKPAVAAAPAAAKPAAPVPAPAPAAAKPTAPKMAADAAAKAVVYSDVIAPILAEKCYSCHGEEKSKGKLRMHTFADLKKGGSEGDVNLVAGKSVDSLMIQRILLPKDDDEHMPPEDEPQVTKEELALLKWWIDNGASETETIAASKKTPEIEGLLAVALTKLPAKSADVVKKVEKPKAKPLTEAQKKLVTEITAKLQALNATLMPLAQDTEQLRLSVINAADKFGDKELALLTPIAEQIAWLDLARSQVTDAGLDVVAKMPYLERLHLENTKIGDAGLAKLGGLPALEYLNLYGTKVTDGGIAKLAGAKSLKKLFVWQTGVTKAGATALEGKLAGLVVNVGLSEAEIAKLTAPPPAPPPAPAKVEEKKPAPAPAPAKVEEKKPVPAPAPAKAAPAQPPVPQKPAEAAKPVVKPAEAPPAAKAAAPAPAPAAKSEAQGK